MATKYIPTTPWLKIGAFFFTIGATYELLMIKGGYYEHMRKREAHSLVDRAEERQQWFAAWRDQGISLPAELAAHRAEEDCNEE